MSKPTVYRIDCNVFRPVPPPHRLLSSLSERLLLAFRSLKGYSYYYCEESGKLCAYLFLKHNYLGYYTFMEKSDLLLNPYMTLPPYRRRGYASALLERAVKDAAESGHTIYAVVVADNVASQQVLLKEGFMLEGYVTHTLETIRRSKLTKTHTPTNLLLFVRK